MTDPRPLVSPVMVGRDDLLALADRRRAEAHDGRGALLLLSGEAGVGKSRLAGAIERRTLAEGFVVARGTTFPGDVEVAGGVLLDLARGMRRVPALEAAGEGLASRLEDPSRGGAGGDPHRRRRLLLLDVVDLLAGAPARAGRPVLLLLEDLHWTDELSLDALAALARRLPEARLLVVATIRTDELYPTLPVRSWRSTLLAGRLAEEARVRRLGRDDTATMVSLLRPTGLPAPRDLVDAIHDRSDGVPLHIEELVALLPPAGAAGEVSAGTGAAGVPAGPATAGATAGATVLRSAAHAPLAAVPETLEEAVLGRAARLSPRARRAADAAAVIGRSFRRELLAAVLGRPVDRLGPELAELERAYLVVAASDGSSLDFRHALIRDALYGQVDAAERRRLHARVADATDGATGYRAAFRSLHLELAGREAEAFEASVAGAVVAARLSAHREARELLERALRTAPATLDRVRRAEVLAGLADEAAATDDNAAADGFYAAAHATFLAAGRPVRAAAVVPRHVAVRHLLGDGLAAREARLRAALALLDGASADPGPDESGPDEPGPDESSLATLVRGRLLAGLSAATMLDRRLEASIAWGEAGRELALAAGDEPTELDIAATVGSCHVFAGRMDDGWRMLEEAVDRSRAARFEAQAARAYRMVASCASVLVEYDRAERLLRDGIAYAEQVELWNHRHYLAAHLAHVLWATGAWDDADRAAAQALADGRGGITTRITALYALGYVALGRGDHDRADDLLREALGLADRMRELQRVSPVLWGLAESARIAGDASAATEWCERGAAASAEVDDAAYLFPFLVTGTRARLDAGDPAGAEAWAARTTAAVERRAIPGTLPAVAQARGLVALARGSTGAARDRFEEAARGWDARRRTWEGAWARLDLASALARANRPADAAREAGAVRDVADRLRSAPLGDAAAGLLRRARARAPLDAAWAPLTTRELEVARHIARGSTNAEIAGELGVAPRTVTAHVEHILAKLGVARRAEVAAWVTRVAPDPDADARDHDG